MASTCDIYKGGIKLGSGVIAEDLFTVTSWVPLVSTARINSRNIRVTCTQAGTHAGRTFNTRITDDNGSGTLTMRNRCHFVGA